MTAVRDDVARGLARRLLFTLADLEILQEILPGPLPASMVPRSALLRGLENSRESVVDGLVERGVVLPEATGLAAAPAFGRTWSILAGAPTALELIVSGQGPSPDASAPVGHHAWVAMLGEAAASLRTVDAHQTEMSAFLTAGLADELHGLIPGPTEFGTQRTLSISEALAAPTTASSTGADATGPDRARLQADTPAASALMRSVHANLRCTVMTRTPRGPAAGTLTWVATPTAWWQVDLDWRRWQRTGEKQTVLTAVRTDEAGRTLAAEVSRLLRAGAGLTPPSERGER